MDNIDGSAERMSLLELDIAGKPADLGFDTSDSASVQAPTLPEAGSVTVTPAPEPQVKEITKTELDQAGVRRCVADDEAARKAGFSLAAPLYEMGTRVVALGVENAKRSRAEWDELPMLGEACQSLVSRVAAEERADIKVDLPNLSMLDNGQLKVNTNGTYKTTPRAVEGLAFFSVPGGGGGNYFNGCPSDLRAHNLNHWFSRGYRIDKRATVAANPEGMAYEDMEKVYIPRDVTVRTRKSAEGGREAFAVTGPRYGTFDVDKVCAKVYEALAGKGDSRCELLYDGYQLKMNVLFHSNVDASDYRAGEIFKAGLRIKAADDGSGSINVSTELLRNCCLNLIILSHSNVLVGRRRHSGKTADIADKIQEHLDTAQERIGYFIKAWNAATVENILEKYGVGDVRAAFTGLVLNKVVTVPGVRPDDLVNKLMTAWNDEPETSKAGIINAITKMAHTETWSSWEIQEELEEKAGELLFAKQLDVVYKGKETLADALGGW